MNFDQNFLTAFPANCVFRPEARKFNARRKLNFKKAKIMQFLHSCVNFPTFSNILQVPTFPKVTISIRLLNIDQKVIQLIFHSDAKIKRWAKIMQFSLELFHKFSKILLRPWDSAPGPPYEADAYGTPHPQNPKF